MYVCDKTNNNPSKRGFELVPFSLTKLFETNTTKNRLDADMPLIELNKLRFVFY